MSKRKTEKSGAELLAEIDSLPKDKPSILLKTQGTAASKDAIEKLSPKHEMLLDYMVANPGKTQKELAEIFEYSEVWISKIVNSDAFLAEVARRREKLLSPDAVAQMNVKLHKLADKSMDVIEKELNKANVDPNFALETLKVSTTTISNGQKNIQIGNSQNNFVIINPGQAVSASEWLKTINADLSGGE